MQLNMSINSEYLTVDELAGISGRARKDDQIAWLVAKGWRHTVNAAGAPIVGRWYARMKLAGVDLAESLSQQPVMPDFSKAR